MDHGIWWSSSKAMTCVSLSICNRPEPSKSSKQNSKMDKRVVEFPNPNIVWVSMVLYHLAPYNVVHIIWNSYLELARIFLNFRSSIHEVGLGKSKVRRKTIPSMQSVFSDCKRDSITQTESVSSTSQKSQKFYRLRATILIFLPIQEWSPNSYRL